MEAYQSRARRNYRRKLKRLERIRKISGVVMTFAFFGILGTAGASDNGAELLQVIRQGLIFGSLFIGSYAVWNLTGGGN